MVEKRLAEPRSDRLPTISTFCRQKPEEHIEELVLIISNATFDDGSHKAAKGNSRLEATMTGCHGWVGTSKATYHWNDGTYQEDSTTTAHITWEEDNIFFGCGCVSFFPSEDSTVDWTWEYRILTEPTCFESYSGSIPASPGFRPLEQVGFHAIHRRGGVTGRRKRK